MGAELKYGTHEREALATVYCCQQWRHYLLGSVVFVQTDHKPNLAMEKNKLANERVGKWARALQEYAPKFFQKDGKAHADADSLSHMPLPAEHSVDTGAPFCRHCNLPVDGSIPIHSGLEASIARVEVGGVSPLAAVVPFLDKVKAALPSDPFVSDLFRYLQEGTLPVETNRRKNVMVQEDSFDVRDGLLYRYKKGGTEQLYVPPALRDTVLTMHHDHPMGRYPAVKRLSQRLLAEFWWPRLRKDAREWVYKCRPCQERRNQPKSRNPQTLPVPFRPFQRVGIDVVGPVPMSRRGNRFMLIITYALTRWPEVFALPEVPAWKVVKILFEEIICRYRFIETLVSNRGTNFFAEIVQELLKLVKARHLTTTSYHSQGNTIPERFNQTLVQGLGKQVDEERGDWDLYLQPFLASYRTTEYAETGYSPFGLVFAHDSQSILQVTPVPEGARAPSVCYDEYAGFIRQQRIERVDRARGRAERERQARERRNPPQMTEKFCLGDRILLQKPTPNLGKQPKFAMKFEEGQTFVVVAVPHDRPHVAVIRPLGGKERDVISTDCLML
uniref:Integrase catalytic domain-containing protein n=1 Tax=Chromera velia CCMP2878 TaxID=1169474 RepID=A0A0G4HDA7_9ALVE|eukprot:Cvel_26473.t1-p1 / transcript=Cvel_26473.t1 / gene=Cvel_26473 / organism=Chromera_velia_CCMP2878 / gene_product=Retrovirus-related Pol polyprotein from transposon, putative / transcript_product=Retrovirus-related Pol polyprotein from transposon, putative / location=Cvel_scaffold3152:8908-10578(-) / protein_length=557 / sequence_SO=supercontig / SO=protein_coding / is_pseudo=false